MIQSQSYNSKVKELLCRKTAVEVGLDSEAENTSLKRCDKCCALAFFYGVTLVSRRLKPETMTLSIENESLLEICTYIMIHHFLAKPDVKQIERSGKVRFEVTFGRDLIGRELFEKLNDDEKDFSFVCECEDCYRFFLRGAFLSTGMVYDPASDYRVEFIMKDQKNAKALTEFIGRYFAPKIIKRRLDHVVYIKGGERTEEFCALIGAESTAMDIINKSIEKETMNALNRNCNCEAANIRKTVNASVSIRNAIQKLKETGRFDSLTPDLKDTAELRERYPDASLTELANMTNGAISRSGINHRLKKLVEIAEE